MLYEVAGVFMYVALPQAVLSTGLASLLQSHFLTSFMVYLNSSRSVLGSALASAFFRCCLIILFMVFSS